MYTLFNYFISSIQIFIFFTLFAPLNKAHAFNTWRSSPFGDARTSDRTRRACERRRRRPLHKWRQRQDGSILFDLQSATESCHARESTSYTRVLRRRSALF